MPLNVIFMGTPEFAARSLAAIHDAGHGIAAVYTQPPRPGGRRGLDLRKSPVHILAEDLGLAVRTPVTLANAAERDAFAALGADIAVVVAYGLVLPAPVLGATRHGALNAHASSLPRWRGAAPIQRAIMAGDTDTALMIMKVDEGLDTGPVALSRRLAIGPDETAGELEARMAEAGAGLLCEALLRLEAGTLSFVPQASEGASYARKISKEETRIDWERPAGMVHNHIRGLSPFPGAWCEMKIGERIERVKVLESRLVPGNGVPGEMLDNGLTVACASGAVRLVRLQRAGGRALAASEFLRGAPVGAVS